MTETNGTNPKAPAGLSTRQLRFIAARLACPTVEAACQQARIGKTTAYQWLKTPSFRAELDRQRDGVFHEAMNDLKATARKAVAGLRDLTEATVAPAVRRSACKDVIGFAQQWANMQEIEQRLAALEKRLLQEKGAP